MNRKFVKKFRTVLFRRRDMMTQKYRGFYYDPFFADPEAVEDDYRRLKGGHG